MFYFLILFVLFCIGLGVLWVLGKILFTLLSVLIQVGLLLLLGIFLIRWWNGRKAYKSGYRTYYSK